MVRSRASLHLEIIALRHQLAVVHRSRRPRLRLTSADRVLWAWLSQAWSGWRSAVHIVKPDTVIAWHRRGFRLFWTWKSRRRIGRPGVPPDVRALIRELSTANPLWGAPRIHGELQKLGISVSQSTVAKYMRRPPRPPSQTWRTFLTNHASQIMAADFFVVPTVTFGCSSCSSSSRTTVDGSCMSRSPIIRRRPGRPSSSAMPSQTTRRPRICCTIAMRSSQGSRPPSPACTSRPSHRRRARPGRRTTLHTAPHWADPERTSSGSAVR